MWDINKGLIQIEVGSGVIRQFTRKDTRGAVQKLLGASAPQAGELFVPETERLRKELQEQNVYFPSVHYTDNDELQPNQFIIYIGIESFFGDITKQNLIELLRNVVSERQIKDPSPQTVRDIFAEGVQYYQEKDYNRAAPEFARTYYWGSILNCQDEVVNSIINMGTIMLVNNRVEDAQLYAESACVRVEDPSFFNLNLRFNTHNFLANVYWLMGKRELAAENYEKAVVDVKYSEDIAVTVFALWNAANAHMGTGNYTRSSALLDNIFSLIYDDEHFSKGTVQSLYKLRAMVSDQHIMQLQKQNYELTQQIQELNNSFSIGLKGTVVTFMQNSGPMLLQTFGGWLIGSLSHIEINNHSKNNVSINMQ